MEDEDWITLVRAEWNTIEHFLLWSIQVIICPSGEMISIWKQRGDREQVKEEKGILLFAATINDCKMVILQSLIVAANDNNTWARSWLKMG